MRGERDELRLLAIDLGQAHIGLLEIIGQFLDLFALFHLAQDTPDEDDAAQQDGGEVGDVEDDLAQSGGVYDIEETEHAQYEGHESNGGHLDVEEVVAVDGVGGKTYKRQYK